MFNIFFVSDTHFGHKNIIKPEFCHRPFASVEEMNEKLIDNWNKIVKKGDRVFHLGDFAFMKYAELTTVLDRLEGDTHLILGNHDRTIEDHKAELLRDQYFASIQHYREMKVKDQLIIMLHYGMRVWRNSHYGSIALFGHSHGSLPPYGKSVDVGVDANFIFPREKQEDYRPIHLDEILDFMSKREIAASDYHKEHKQ